MEIESKLRKGWCCHRCGRVDEKHHLYELEEEMDGNRFAFFCHRCAKILQQEFNVNMIAYEHPCAKYDIAAYHYAKTLDKKEAKKWLLRGHERFAEIAKGERFASSQLTLKNLIHSINIEIASEKLMDEFAATYKKLA